MKLFSKGRDAQRRSLINSQSPDFSPLERNWVVLVHLSLLLVMVNPVLGPVIVPAWILALVSPTSHGLETQARDALNFGFTWAVLAAIGIVMGGIIERLIGPPWGDAPRLLAQTICVVGAVRAAWKTKSGDGHLYQWTFHPVLPAIHKSVRPPRV